MAASRSRNVALPAKTTICSGIPAIARHNAVADAFATARLLQVVLAAADRVGMDCPARLDEMQRAHQWLGKR